MNRTSASINGNAISASSSFSTGPTGSSNQDEANSLGSRTLLEQSRETSSSKPLGHRARRAQQSSSHPIETSEWPKEALQMLGEKALRDVQEFERLWGYLMRSKTDSKCVQAAKNAIEALNLACYSFSGKDLSGINIPGANLSCGLFQRTNFSGANLEGVNFQGAHLENVSFVGANLRKVNFGQFNQFSLKDDDSSGRVYCLATRADDIRKQTIVAMGDHYWDGEYTGPKSDVCRDDTYKRVPESNCRIYIWSLEERRRISVWNCRGGVKGVVFTPDGERLVSATTVGCINIWNIQNGALINTFKTNYRAKTDLSQYFLESFDHLVRHECIKPLVDYPDYVEVSLERELFERCFESQEFSLERGSSSQPEGYKSGMEKIGVRNQVAGGKSLARDLEHILNVMQARIGVVDVTVSRNDFSPRIAASNYQSDIYVWDLNERRMISFISGEKALDRLHFSSNENHLIISKTKCIVLLDIATKERLRKWSSADFRIHWSIVFSPQMNILASICSCCRKLEIWSYENEQPIRIHQLDTDPRIATVSSNGKLLALGLDSGIQVWDLIEWSLKFEWRDEIWKNETGSLIALEFVDQDRSLIFLCSGGSPRVMKFVNPKNRKFPEPGGNLSLGISHDQKKMFSLSCNSLKVWGVDSGHCLLELELEAYYGYFALSRSGKEILFMSSTQVTLWDVETRTEIDTLYPPGGIQGIGFLSNGRASIIADDKVISYDLHSKKGYGSLNGKVKGLSSYAFSKDGRWLAIGFKDGSLKVWDSESGKLNSTAAHCSEVHSVEFVGDMIISTSDNVLHWWNCEKGEAKSMQFAGGNILTIPGYPDYLVVLKGALIKVFSKEDGSSLYCLRHTIPLNFQIGDNPSGEIDLHIGISTTGMESELLSRLGGEYGLKGEEEAVAVHPTEPIIAVGGLNGTIQLWNPITNLLVNVLWGQESVCRLKFSDDGLYLFSTSKVICCWDLRSGVMSATLKWRAGFPYLNLHGVKTDDADIDSETLTFIMEQKSRDNADLRFI